MSDSTREEQETQRQDAERDEVREFHRYIIKMGLAIVGALLLLGSIVAASVMTSDFGLLIPLGAAAVYGVFIYFAFDPLRHRPESRPIGSPPLVWSGFFWGGKGG